jgi:nucleotide-binding universal stress UspA family protein
MSIKDLIVHLDEGAGSDARLDAAISLALAFGARLVGLALVAEPFVPLVELPPERLFRERREARADTLLAAAAMRTARAGVNFETRRETAPADRLPELFARHARHADLAVVGRSEPGPDPEGVETPVLQETAFLGTGRPTLIVPAEAEQMPPAQMLVAWDGSREAARAVHDALPLLARAERVSLVVVDPQGLADRVGPEPGADMAAHLARHGVAVEVETVVSGTRSTGEALLARAAETGAGTLVMGGYGHRRLRELVLGGVTRHVLAHATIPVLLSH